MRMYILFFLATACLVSATQAQGIFGVRQRPVNHAKGTQWYVGAITGVNYARATVMQPFSEFSSVNSPSGTEKDYRVLPVQAGYSAGISTTIAYTPYVQMVLAVRYNQLRYAYRQAYQWSDPEREENQLRLDHNHSITLGYVEFPLQVRYAFPINRFKPFAQAGFVYGRLAEAHKELVIHTTDYASGGLVQSVSGQQTSEVSTSYLKSQAAYTLGGGIMYNFGGLMLVAEANYRRGLHNVTNTQTRYTATRHLEGLGHVPDDIQLHALSYSVSFLFPLKFLTSKVFKPVIF